MEIFIEMTAGEAWPLWDERLAKKGGIPCKNGCEKMKQQQDCRFTQFFAAVTFVVTMFWSIYIYDRELVYPKLLDNFIPAWLNHGMHTTVLPFVLIEMRTTHHQYPSRSCGLAAVCTFAVGYILWVCWIHHVTGVWVYPLLEHLSPGVKIIFFAAVTIVINVFYLVGEVLNNYIWDTQKCIEEGKEKPKLE
ncbi:androgen-induced gene 1 protein isoform X3 [Cinclus cinclus]|uniref:androgen-induced gene 1 protein isoform X3 n=1 Tax=Cinclus cinclus TaxID=127875 RepID=UPI002E10FD47